MSKLAGESLHDSAGELSSFIVNHSPNELHIGRSFVGHPLEDECPCQKAPCGLVVLSKVDPTCPEHRFMAAKTIRQTHQLAKCPGERSTTEN